MQLLQGLLVKGSPAFCTSNVTLFFSCARLLNKVLSVCCCLLSVAAVDACQNPLQHLKCARNTWLLSKKAQHVCDVLVGLVRSLCPV